MNNSQHKKHISRNILIATGSVLAVAIILCIMVMSPGAPREAVIRIPSGAALSNISDSLTTHLSPAYSRKVIILMKMMRVNPSARHGAYMITKGLSPLRAAHKLTKGAQKPVKITINGFRSLNLMAERIAAKLDFTPDSLLALLSKAETLKPYGLTSEQALSLFLDDTYEVYWSASPQDIIDKIGSNYKDVWNEHRQQLAAREGLTPAQIMTLASIVDEETNAQGEKGEIGRLYMNRLKKGMRLQADPTIRFALNDFTIKRVGGAHLMVESPYNTYKHNGLPPGPLRTTSVATIDAVLESKPSDALYMCAKEDFSGTHRFAATYSEHQENAHRYRKALSAKGIELRTNQQHK